MKKLYVTLILAAAALCPQLAGAQAVGGGVVSLDSCRNMALRHNKTLQAADQAIVGAGHLRKAAHAAYLPGIDLTAAYFYNQNKIQLLGADAKLPTMTFNPKTQGFDYNLVMNPLTGQPVTDPATGSPIPSEVAVIPKEAMSYDVHNVFAGAITLTQPLYMGGEIRAMNEITKYAEQLAISTRNSAAQEVIYSVDEAYWLVVSLGQKKKLAESFCALVDSLNYDVHAMYDEGVATKSDCLTVDVKRNESQIALTKVDNGLQLARMALNRLCGLPIDTRFTLQDEGLDNPHGAPHGALSSDMQGVYDRRQDLQSMRTGIKIFEQQEKVARAAMLPKLALVAAYSVMNPNVIDGFEKRFGGGFSVGAMLTVPLWHWGGNKNKLRAAEAATAAQRLALEDAESLVDLQVSQARFKYEEAQKTLKMTVTNLESANANLHNAEYGFKEGVLTSDDVTAAQTAWLQAHSEHIDAEIGVQLCRVYLSKVLGTMMY